MYILAPLIIILVAAAIVAVIVGRKFPYLKKLPIEAAVPETGLLEGFLPEVYRFFKKADFSFYRELLFKEMEKFLRRLRLVSLKIDSLTKKLIDKIRMKGTKKEKPEILIEESEEEKAGGSIAEKIPLEEQQKKEEHALIIEIAKNPKNAELYKKLADLYILAENFADAVEALETALKLDPDDKKTPAKLRAVQKALPNRPE